MNENENKEFNLHTHSWYCGHGVGELSEYVDVALKGGLSVLGFSEHCPMPSERWPGSRMPFKSLETYLGECRALQSSNSEISILTGLECDYDPLFHNWYQEYLLDSHRVDYLIAGVHYLTNDVVIDRYIQHFPNDRKALYAYTDSYIETLSSGLFSYCVHPDLFGMFYAEWDSDAIACSRAILECASSLSIPLEINGYGLNKPHISTKMGKRRQYPFHSFWFLSKEYDIKIVASSDAHRPTDVVSQLEDALSFAKELELELSSLIINTSKDGNRTLLFT
ncbi:MAG: histidinol-phosphatase HisJ family protein [Spirochaetia bacterium]|nr:histidinol-phosphatase HisJ family protein [Spirochaetia bacterium]